MVYKSRDRLNLVQAARFVCKYDQLRPGFVLIGELSFVSLFTRTHIADMLNIQLYSIIHSSVCVSDGFRHKGHQDTLDIFVFTITLSHSPPLPPTHTRAIGHRNICLTLVFVIKFLAKTANQ